MFAKILPRDRLCISVRAATRVYCVHCRRHIFYLKKDSGGVSLRNLAPLQGAQEPQGFACPECGRDFRAYAPEPTLKTDKGYVK